MSEYTVIHRIQVWAPSPELAAEVCLLIHRDPESTATFFDVEDETGKILLKDYEVH